MPEDTELQHSAPVGVTWEHVTPKPEMRVTLTLQMPDYATVALSGTGQIELDNLQISDLVSLRDVLTDQIQQLTAALERGEEIPAGSQR